LLNTGAFVVGDGGLGSLPIQAGGTAATALGTVADPPGAVIAMLPARLADHDRARGGGGRGAAPIVWLGQWEVDCAWYAAPRKVWPLQVAAVAFGPGRLSPDDAARLWEAFGRTPLGVTGPQLAAARGLVEGFAAARESA